MDGEEIPLASGGVEDGNGMSSRKDKREREKKKDKKKKSKKSKKKKSKKEKKEKSAKKNRKRSSKKKRSKRPSPSTSSSADSESDSSTSSASTVLPPSKRRRLSSSPAAASQPPTTGGARRSLSLLAHPSSSPLSVPNSPFPSSSMAPPPKTVGSHIDSSDPDQTHHLMSPPGTILKDRYVINGDLGLGTFGRVLCCRDMKGKGSVAVKVIRSIKRYEESAKIERGVLMDVNERGGRGVELCVRMLDSFNHGGHFCMVFEPLSVSLYDLIKGNDYAPLPLRLCWRIARDLVEGVGFLHEMSLIHTDLKLENVMFRGGESFFMEDYRRRKVRLPRGGGVKIIDFGGATYDNQHKGKTINTRQYRAPEVILQLGWSMPSDMWSLGCILAEISSGDLLFSTHDNREHLAMIERCCGKFPSDMVRASKVVDGIFEEDGWHAGGLDKSSARHVQRVKCIDEEFGWSGRGWCGLMKGCLTVNPGRRIRAREAVRDFFD